MYTINPTRLRDPRILRVREITTNELARCCQPNTIKAVEQFNGRVTAHNTEVDSITNAVNGLLAGEVKGDPMKLNKELGPNRVRLTVAAIGLREDRAKLRDSVKADFGNWQRGAKQLYDSQKRVLSETAHAVASGNTRLAEEIMGNNPKLSELRNDALDWFGPTVLRESQIDQETETLNGKYALVVAISDASGLQLEWPQTIKTDY
jgi:hypothetical protein